MITSTRRTPSHYRPDHIGWQPWDAIDGEHALCQRGLPDPRSASDKVDDVRTHTGILPLPGAGAAVSVVFRASKPSSAMLGGCLALPAGAAVTFAAHPFPLALRP